MSVKTKGAVSRALRTQTASDEPYGQAPEVMSADGPALWYEDAPTVESMQ
jgi:hypothetical protein